MTGIELPETWRFLGGMWWILHIIALGLVFFIGYLVGSTSATNRRDRDSFGDAPENRPREPVPPGGTHPDSTANG